jgi:hypothetical protein
MKFSTAQRPFFQFELMRYIHFQSKASSTDDVDAEALEGSGLTNLPSARP